MLCWVGSGESRGNEKKWKRCSWKGQLHIKGKEADRSDKRIYLGDGKNGTVIRLSPDANGSS